MLFSTFCDNFSFLKIMTLKISIFAQRIAEPRIVFVPFPADSMAEQSDSGEMREYQTDLQYLEVGSWHSSNHALADSICRILDVVYLPCIFESHIAHHQ